MFVRCSACDGTGKLRIEVDGEVEIVNCTNPECDSGQVWISVPGIDDKWPKKTKLDDGFFEASPML